MKLTFPTFREVLGSLDLLDASLPSVSRPATCLLFKNVRCFKDWSIVPLSRFNILTGPNSSGKSTLIELLAALNVEEFGQHCIDKLVTHGSESVYLGFSTDWQEYVSERRGDDPGGGFDTIFHDSFLSRIVDDFSDAKLKKPQRAQPRRLTYILNWTDCGRLATVYIYGDRDCLAAIRFEEDTAEFEAIRLRISPALFHSLFSDKFSADIKETLQCLPWWKTPALGNRELPGSFNRKLREYWIPSADTAFFNLWDGPCLRMGESLDSAKDAAFVQALIWVVFYQPVWGLVDIFGRDLLHDVRQKSSPEQLTYRFAKNTFKFFLSLSDEEKERTDPAFASLAQILAEDENRRHKTTKKPGEKELARINDFLKKTLGSSITLGFRRSVSRDDNKSINEIKVQLFLKGKGGTKLSFSDVGTGVSQVLPVLASGGGYLGSGGFRGGGIYRQPELHLHPRAQAELGDFFIATLNSSAKCGLTLETHSEHLILRLLRRIRERLPRTSHLHLRSEDLSLVYLHPTKAGSEVHLIRVDENGDFLDPWPAGFFEDRYEDLFFTEK